MLRRPHPWEGSWLRCPRRRARSTPSRCRTWPPHCAGTPAPRACRFSVRDWMPAIAMPRGGLRLSSTRRRCRTGWSGCRHPRTPRPAQPSTCTAASMRWKAARCGCWIRRGRWSMRPTWMRPVASICAATPGCPGWPRSRCGCWMPMGAKSNRCRCRWRSLPGRSSACCCWPARPARSSATCAAGPKMPGWTCTWKSPSAAALGWVTDRRRPPPMASANTTW